MKWLGTARLFLDNAIWRATGSQAAGRHLVNALGSEDENVRTIAGMLLVQGGKQAEALLEEALEQCQHLPLVLTIIGDLGDRKFAAKLRKFTEDRDPAVAKAARDALGVLAAQEELSANR